MLFSYKLFSLPYIRSLGPLRQVPQLTASWIKKSLTGRGAGSRFSSFTSHRQHSDIWQGGRPETDSLPHCQD